MFGFASSGQVCHPLQYSRMLVLAGHQKSTSPSCSFFNRANRPGEGEEFLQGPISGPVRILIHTCGHFSQAHPHAHHRCGARLALETPVGGVRLAVIRKKTLALMGPGRHGQGHLYGEVCPKCLGQGLWARVSWTWLSPQHEAWTAPDQLGPGKVEIGIKERWLLDEHHCPRPGPCSARSQGCQGPFPSS